MHNNKLFKYTTRSSNMHSDEVYTPLEVFYCDKELPSSAQLCSDCKGEKKRPGSLKCILSSVCKCCIFRIWKYKKLFRAVSEGMAGWFNWSLPCLILRFHEYRWKYKLRTIQKNTKKMYFILLSLISLVLFSQGHRNLVIMATEEQM